MITWLIKKLKWVYGKSPEAQAGARGYLFAIKGPLGGQVFPLGKPRFYIGRQEGFDLRMPDQDRTVSRRHAFITFKRGRFTITDTSMNGSYVNGQKISKHP